MPRIIIEEYVLFFNEEFLPAYSDLTGFIANKPQEVLISLEHAFSHTMQHFNPDIDTAIREANIEKAYNHLQRATLDSYKLFWLYMDEEITELINNPNVRKFCVNMPEGELLSAYHRFRERAQSARLVEGRSVGVDIMPSIVAYKDACNQGKRIFSSIDVTKMADYDRLRVKARRFFTAKEFIIGFAAGLASSLVVYFATQFFLLPK